LKAVIVLKILRHLGKLYQTINFPSFIQLINQELMKKITSILAIILFTATLANAQKYMTKGGTIRFSSDTPMEKIDAVNRQVNSALDFATGNFVFKVLIRGFEFEKALMQEHFNENYMESEKFPNSTFNGKITNIKDVNLAKDGVYKVVAEGDLFMHGVTNKVKVNGTLEVKAGKVLGVATFNVDPKDYNITIPAAVIKNISETIKVDVNITLDILK
jgi:polyisoprenoid-binding protein YceI